MLSEDRVKEIITTMLKSRGAEKAYEHFVDELNELTLSLLTEEESDMLSEPAMPDSEVTDQWYAISDAIEAAIANHGWNPELAILHYKERMADDATKK